MLSEDDKRRIYDQGGEDALKEGGGGHGGMGNATDIFNMFFGGGSSRERRTKSIVHEVLRTEREMSVVLTIPCFPRSQSVLRTPIMAALQNSQFNARSYVPNAMAEGPKEQPVQLHLHVTRVEVKCVDVVSFYKTPYSPHTFWPVSGGRSQASSARPRHGATGADELQCLLWIWHCHS